MDGQSSGRAGQRGFCRLAAPFYSGALCRGALFREFLAVMWEKCEQKKACQSIHR